MKKAPKAKNYLGNPMGYFNDKAAYGKEMMRKAQEGTETRTDSNIEPLEAIQEVGKDIRQNRIERLKQKNAMAKIKADTAAAKADKARSNAEKRAARHSERIIPRGQDGREVKRMDRSGDSWKSKGKVVKKDGNFKKSKTKTKFADGTKQKTVMKNTIMGPKAKSVYKAPGKKRNVYKSVSNRKVRQ
jgi:hypothetical protein